MEFLKKIFKKEKRSNITLLLALLVFILYLVFSYFWSIKSEVYAFDFLPENTVFYYEWTNHDALSFDLSQVSNFIDLSESQRKLNFLQNIFGNKYADLQEIVWFHTKDSQEEYYLLRFSNLTDNFVERLNLSNAEYKFVQPSDNILLVYQTQQPKLPRLVVRRFTINRIRSGQNVFWHLDYVPDFLKKTSDFLQPFLKHKEVAVNISDSGINVWQQQINQEFSAVDFEKVWLPRDFDLLSTFDVQNTAGLVNMLANQVIIGSYSGLPYYNLTQDKLKEYFISNTVVVQRGNNWLLVRDSDWQALAIDLAGSLQLEEKNRLLPDGTAYIELVATENQGLETHIFDSQEYWQIGDLYGVKSGQFYYLSDNKSMIEEVISQQNSLYDLAHKCNKTIDYFVSDIIWWKVNNINNHTLQDYLEQKNLQNLHIFSYQNSNTRGLSWCF